MTQRAFKHARQQMLHRIKPVLYSDDASLNFFLHFESFFFAFVISGGMSMRSHVVTRWPLTIFKQLYLRVFATCMRPSLTLSL